MGAFSGFVPAGRAWVPARLVGRRGFDRRCGSIAHRCGTELRSPADDAVGSANRSLCRPSIVDGGGRTRIFHRYRLLLVGVGVALTAALGAVPAQAAGSPVAGQLPSGTLRPGVTPDPQTCAKVHQAGLDAPRVPSAAVSAAVAARGAKFITCTLPSTVGPGPITNAVEPRVQCTGEQSRINRSSSCNSELRTLVLFVQLEGGGQVILGTINFSVRNQVILDGRNATWTDTITFVAIKSSGDLRLRDTTVTATAVCGFGCTVRLPSIIVSRPFFPGLAPQVQDTATFDPTLAGAGDKVFTNDRWEYFFSNPAATPPNTQTAMIWSGPHRCETRPW